ncbi:MAG: LamG-like jellyroll fold domain-containing protein [Anaerolineales bacterium]
MIFQATSSDASPTNVSTRCYVTSTTNITCDRDGTVGAVNIAWQTAEFTSGVTVEHLTPVCNEDGDADFDITNVAITAVSDMSKTFLLASHKTSGSTYDANDPRTVRLTSTTNVEIHQHGYGSCATGSESALQVVQYNGASVTRGVTGAMTGTSLSVTGLASVTTGNTMLLYSYRFNGSGAAMCDRMLRGEIDTATSLSFTRSDGGAGCAASPIPAIAWERVEFTDGTTVEQVQPAMAATVATDNVTVSSVDLGRSVVFAGGQHTAGQAIGEGSYALNDILGAMVGRHTLTSPTNLLVTRDDTNGSARWTSYVVQFPAPESVDITVSVHHTKTDGSVPTLIVSSASTTIDSSTANPLALSVGSGAAQTFTSADPQLLRAHVTVDSVTSSGSFILDYDSVADPSSLDTPVVTVPEWGLAFLLLVPLVPFLMSAIWRRRRLAGSIATVLIGAILAVSLLAAQVTPTTAAPDVFYLHTDPTSGLTPAGEYMDLIEGTGGTFDTGTGADGSVTLAASANINTDIIGSLRAGSADGISTSVTANPTGTSISVGSTTGFATGDEILLINMRGSLGDTVDVGNYEFLEISSVGASTLNLTSSIQKSYDGTTFSNQVIRVQRVPQWTSVTINSGGTLTANAWNGTSGGIIVFRATGTVTVNGTGSIDATGLGYRGGAGGTLDGGANGESYEGQNGKGGANLSQGTLGGGAGANYNTQNNTTGTRGGGGGGGETPSGRGRGGGGAGGRGYGGGGGGGGGGTDSDAYISGVGGAGGTTDDSAGGGGHGENSGTSGDGGAAGNPGNDGGVSLAKGGGLAGSGSTTGQGGHAEDASDSPGGGGGGGGNYGLAALTQLFFGSGGGGGGDAGFWAGAGETGGDGGGIIFIIANSVDNNATIQLQGADGITATDGDGASGGGAGGSLLIQANSVDNTGGTITAAGGAGGARDSNPDAGGGGGGGVGRIRIESDTIIGTTSPAASTAGTPGGNPKKTFNSVGSTYWYHDVAWPTGNDDATIAAGNYTFNMYFSSLPTGSNWYDTNWLYRKQITVQSAQVDSTESNIPVYVDLADLGADFFSNVKSDGGDIRVTNSDGATEMAREVVAINTGAQTGELHFRADNLSSSANTSFYIYYGNGGASDYAVTAPFGRNAVWSNNYAAVYHLEEDAAGTGTLNLYVDSTGNGNDGDDQVSATGQIGRLGAGQELDGSDDFVDMGDVLDFADPANFTLESWIRPSIPPSAGPLQVSGTSSFTNYDAVPSVTFQHTTPSGSNRLLIVAVSFDNDNLETVTSVTYNGDPLTLINTVQRNDDARVELWARVAPDVGTNLDVVVTFSTDPLPILQGGTAGATSFTGAQQVIPNPADFVSAAATSAGPAQVNVTSAAGELVFAAVGCETCDGLTPVAMTEQWNDVNPISPAYYGAAATKAGTSTTTMRWDIVKVAGDHWAIGAIPIRPDAGGLSDQMSFITKWGGTGADRSYRFEVETDNTLTFLPGGGVDPLLNSTTTMNTDTWYHAAVSVQQSSDSIWLYLDGTQEDSNLAWTGALGNSTYSFNLGRRADISQWFDGNLDEVRISSTNRPAGWIGTSFNNQNSPSTFYNAAGQEAYQSVDITVHVHHTATDGTGATPITSASTTIDASTADPLAFDIGNDAIGQTFTSADPRVLRVQVEVTAVNGGGSFVLEYDGPCASNACSSLDTPVVVVPDFALIFGAFAVLIPVAMGGLWRRRRNRPRANAKDADAARQAHDPLAHSHRRKEPSRSLASAIDQTRTP